MRLINVKFEEEGGNMPMSAWDTNAPGLVITLYATDEQVDHDSFTITHEGSGLRILDHRFYSFEIAKLFVDKIADYADWSVKDGEELRTILAEKATPEDRYALMSKLATDLEEEVESNPMAFLTFSEEDLNG